MRITPRVEIETALRFPGRCSHYNAVQILLIGQCRCTHGARPLLNRHHVEIWEVAANARPHPNAATNATLGPPPARPSTDSHSDCARLREELRERSDTLALIRGMGEAQDLSMLEAEVEELTRRLASLTRVRSAGGGNWLNMQRENRSSTRSAGGLEGIGGGQCCLEGCDNSVAPGTRPNGQPKLACCREHRRLAKAKAKATDGRRKARGGRREEVEAKPCAADTAEQPSHMDHIKRWLISLDDLGETFAQASRTS